MKWRGGPWRSRHICPQEHDILRSCPVQGVEGKEVGQVGAGAALPLLWREGVIQCVGVGPESFP